MTRLHRAHTHTPQQHSLCLHNLGLNCLPTLLSERERLSPHRRAKDLSLISARQTRTDNNKRNTGASDSSHSEDTTIYDMFDLPARLPAIFFFRKLWENRENLILAFQCGSLTDGFVVFNTICQIVTNESDMMAPLSPSVAKADIFAVQKVYSHHIFTCPALAHSEDQHDTSPPLWRHCRFHIGYRSSEIIIPIVRIGGGICFKNIPPFAILN